MSQPSGPQIPGIATLGMAVLFSAAVPAPSLMAQPAAPRVLKTPASARALALGDAAVTSTDADALFYNPAMLATARGAAFSIQRDAARRTAGAIATLTTVGPVTIGIGAQHLDFDARNELAFPAVVGLSPTSVPAGSSAFTVGAARGVRRAKVGVAVRYADERIGFDRNGGVTVDAGMQMPLWLGTVGLSAQHLGGTRASTNQTRPHRLSLGWSATRPVHVAWDLGVTTQVTVEADGFVRPIGALEASYVPIQGVAITARGGVRAAQFAEEALATGGFGVTIDHLSLDYAIEPRRATAPVVHRIGVRVR